MKSSTNLYLDSIPNYLRCSYFTPLAHKISLEPAVVLSVLLEIHVKISNYDLDFVDIDGYVAFTCSLEYLSESTAISIEKLTGTTEENPVVVLENYGLIRRVTDTLRSTNTTTTYFMIDQKVYNTMFNQAVDEYEKRVEANPNLKKH